MRHRSALSTGSGLNLLVSLKIRYDDLATIGEDAGLETMNCESR